MEVGTYELIDLSISPETGDLNWIVLVDKDEHFHVLTVDDWSVYDDQGKQLDNGRPASEH